MRIYKRKEFLKLPEGTFFAKGQEWYIDGFCIKGETWKDSKGQDMDFLYENLVQIDFHDSEQLADRQYEMLEKGTSYAINKMGMRDGSFDDKDIFLVFEREDLIYIKERIENETRN